MCPEWTLRVSWGEPEPGRGPSIRPQTQWFGAIHELLKSKKSNILFQIGIQLPYEQCPAIRERDADRLFVKAFTAFRPFVADVYKWNAAKLADTCET